MERVVCTLCHTDRTRPRYRKFNLEIVQCRNCGLVYAGPDRLTREETWTRYNPNYFQDEYLPALGVVNGQFNLAEFDQRYARPLAMIRPFRQYGTLLEVGCGAGFFLKAAERDGWDVQGIEVMDAGITFAQERLGLRVQRGVLEELEFPPASFDVIALFEVIEHLSTPITTLERIWHLLRPGGWLIITTPNIDALSCHMLGSAWAVLSPAEHLYYFNQNTLGQTLRRAGYGSVWFDRHYAGGGLYETMYPEHNQAPTAVRSRAYTWLVRRFGPWMIYPVQTYGHADGLWCLAQRPPA
jgi:2-polyprenyl-3-methyl-5-hydroxy-6-metoxy-1,4-benzoquinol methylase